MALVIVFIPDPRMATRELVRVVRPGGVVATYVWEFPDGFPPAPLAAAMKDLGLAPPERPNVQASARGAMQAIWKEAGLTAIETEVIRFASVFPASPISGILTPCRSDRPAKRSRSFRRARSNN